MSEDRMSREEFWGDLAGITFVEDLLVKAYEHNDKKIWEEDLENSPHGFAWSTSFHASSYPGDDPFVCGREQVYGLMNPANPEPFSPRTRALFDTGTDIENRFVEKLDRYGVLLSSSGPIQTGFENKDLWLTGNADIITFKPFTNKCVVVEVKTTSRDKIIAMKNDYFNNLIYSHPKYVRQIKTYIGELHDQDFSPTVAICLNSGTIISGPKCNHCKDKCIPKLVKFLPPDEGTILYASRELSEDGDPLAIIGYRVEYDEEFMKSGRERLLEWKKLFLEDKIPEHVREGESAKWSVSPCKWCNRKSICKQDYKEKKTKLSESNLVEFTKSIRPHYDPIQARAKVIERWENA